MFSCLGETQRHDFQAETRQLLDIVAKTLYSEKEVCVEKQHSFTWKLPTVTNLFLTTSCSIMHFIIKIMEEIIVQMYMYGT